MATHLSQTDEPLEKTLWQSADRLRKNMGMPERNHVAVSVTCLSSLTG